VNVSDAVAAMNVVVDGEVGKRWERESENKRVLIQGRKDARRSKWAWSGASSAN